MATTHEVKVIFETKEVGKEDKFDNITAREKDIAGKMAGICYMPDDYTSKGMQDSVEAAKRANNCAKNGHYSTFEHGHLTFLINTSKMCAMTLNSLRCYNTSEKSARYTKMKATTDMENNKYEKWIVTFEKLIRAYYGGDFKADQIKKLAMENARYMLSVFTPTTMAYTVSYARAVLTIEWLKSLSVDMSIYCDDILARPLEEGDNKDKNSKNLHYVYYSRLAEELKDLAYAIQEAMGITHPIINDHKGMGIRFYNDIRKHIFNKQHPSYNNKQIIKAFILNRNRINSTLGNVYSVDYEASFAALAQLQRHRTLNYTFESDADLYIDDMDESNFYIPDIIKNSPLKNDWIADLKELVSLNIIPQGIIVSVSESGMIEDFVSKAKERLCSRAQLETCNITKKVAKEISRFRCNDSYENSILLNLKDEEDGTILPRCMFTGYTCKEPCKFGMKKDTLYTRKV